MADEKIWHQHPLSQAKIYTVYVILAAVFSVIGVMFVGGGLVISTASSLFGALAFYLLRRVTDNLQPGELQIGIATGIFWYFMAFWTALQWIHGGIKYLKE